MKWILGIILVWNLVVVGGCKKFAKEIKIFYPLGIGNKWIYHIETDTVVTDSIVIIDTIRWSGRKCYKQAMVYCDE